MHMVWQQATYVRAPVAWYCLPQHCGEPVGEFPHACTGSPETRVYPATALYKTSNNYLDLPCSPAVRTVPVLGVRLQLISKKLDSANAGEDKEKKGRRWARHGLSLMTL